MKLKKKNHELLKAALTKKVKTIKAEIKKYQDAGKSEKSFVWGMIWGMSKDTRDAIMGAVYNDGKHSKLEDTNNIFSDAVIILKDLGFEYRSGISETYENPDGWVTGIHEHNDGSFTALTRVESKDFKTRKGAEKWLEKRGYNADGTKDRS